ncbi:MAG TPA: DUF2383 domain-containing protein [Oculatellaceae cyanobacterium]
MTNAATECTDKLNAMLKGELSALETYRQALEKVRDSNVKATLKECHMCHSGRVDTLVQKIVELGGKPAENSGAWGAFAKMMEGGAAALGDKSAVSMLEEGEDKGLDDYKKLLCDADFEVKSVAATMLPKQEGTHAKMSALKKCFCN